MRVMLAIGPQCTPIGISWRAPLYRRLRFREAGGGQRARQEVRDESNNYPPFKWDRRVPKRSDRLVDAENIEIRTDNKAEANASWAERLSDHFGVASLWKCK